MSTRIPTFYIAQFSQLLSEYGFDLNALLTQNNSALSTLSKPGSVLTVEQFETLIEAIIDLTGLTDLGLRLGQRLQVVHHGPFGLAMANSERVIDVFSLIRNFLAVRLPFLSLSIEYTETSIVIMLHNTLRKPLSQRFVTDALAMAFLNIQSVVIPKQYALPISRLLFDYPCDNSALYQEYFGNTGYRDQAPFSGAILDKQACLQSLPYSDPVSLDYALSLCEQEQQRFSGHLNTVQKVNACFEQSTLSLPSLEEVAQQLFVSKRSLHRQLEKAGTSFIQLREAWLKNQALKYLLINGLSVDMTAQKLGYTDSANFRRAFKRWFSLSPTRYVSHHRHVV